MTFASEIRVVGLGASAGGLEALLEFVSALPSDSGMAFVIVQHMPADQPSLLHEILGARTDIPVCVLADRDKLLPNRIHIVPGAMRLSVESDMISVATTASETQSVVPHPIDDIFMRFADVFGSKVAAVILSGTGADGTSGTRAIKESGGIVIAQSPESAKFQSMPTSVIAAGLADFILQPKEIALKLAEVAEHFENDQASLDVSTADLEDQLERILKLLHEQVGHDFSDYKPGMLTRRISRRMVLGRHRSVADYISELENSKQESQLLAQDFLIGVTYFFRDPGSYDFLSSEVIPWLVRTQHQSIRVWIPGCSTGEEVYSLAILISEEIEKQGFSGEFKVFGTDVDLEALHRARHGSYSADRIENVPAGLREKYFAETSGGGFQIDAALREQCIFAPHNILADPPFSRMGLISFKNVLIYLDSASQARVIPRLYYALMPEGYLALGPSESVGGNTPMFEVVDRKNRVFRRKENVNRSVSSIDFSVSPGFAKFGNADRMAFRVYDAGSEIEPHIEQEYLISFADPFAVIAPDDSIIYLSEAMGDFIRPAKGAVARQLDRMLAGNLRTPVHAVLAEARVGRNAEERNVTVPIAGESKTYDILGRPSAMDDGNVFVIFKEVRFRIATAADAAEVAIARKETELSHKRVRALEANYAASEQKLRSANEELLSMNEELQSSNEELDTSREELQSINEELETINAELTETNSKLARSVNNLENMIQSAGLPKIFLDMDRCVRLFTPETHGIFALRDCDIGRPIAEVSSNLDYAEMLNDINRTIVSETPLNREVNGPDGTVFEARLKPYRTTDHKLDGCVLVFVDVTELRKAAAALEETNQQIERRMSELQAVYDQAPIGLCLLDTEKRWLSINSVLANMNGRPVNEHIGRAMSELLPELNVELEPIVDEVISTGRPIINHEMTGITVGPGSQQRTFLGSYARVEANGKVIGVNCCIQDATEIRQLERKLQARNKELAEREAHLKRIFDNAPLVIAYLEGPNHRYRYSNKLHKRTLGNRDVIGKTIVEALPEIVGQGIVERFDKVYETGEVLVSDVLEAKLKEADGSFSTRYYSQTLQPWYLEDGSLGGVMSFAADITEQHLAKENREIMVHELRHRVKNLLSTVQAIAILSCERAADKEDLIVRLGDRLKVIARANDRIASAQSRSQRLTALLQEELQDAGGIGERVAFRGEDRVLSADVSAALSLVVHELKTNALKYGLLSKPSGFVEILCETDENQALVFIWRELHANGQLTKGESGFGTLLLTEIAPNQIGATAELDITQQELSYRLYIPTD